MNMPGGLFVDSGDTSSSGSGHEDAPIGTPNATDAAAAAAEPASRIAARRGGGGSNCMMAADCDGRQSAASSGGPPESRLLGGHRSRARARARARTRTRTRTRPGEASRSRALRAPPLLLILVLGCLWARELSPRVWAAASRVINIKVGALLEESDHEQANMFIRTIKMINERKDETISRLLSIQRAPPLISGATAAAAAASMAPSSLSSSSSSPSLLSGSIVKPAQLQLQPQRPGIKQQLDYQQQQQQQSRHNRKPDQQQQQQPRPQRARASQADDDDQDQADAEEEVELRQQQQWQSDGFGPPVVKLEPMIEFILDRNSALEADGKVCQLIESGVQALLGPIDGNSVEHVQSICDNMEIPYFELRPYLGSPASAGVANQRVQFGGQPTPTVLLQAAAQAFHPLPSSELSASAKQQQQPQSPPPPPLLPPLHQQAASSSLSGSLESGGAGSLRAQANSPQLPLQSPPQPPRSMPAASQINNAGQQLQPQPQLQPQQLGIEELTLNLHPPAHLLTSAYIDLIYAWNWTSFAIVYEEGSSMIKLQDLFRESSGSWTSKWQIKLFQFDSSPAHHHHHQQRHSSPSLPSGGGGGGHDLPLAAPSSEPQTNNNNSKQQQQQQQQQQQRAHNLSGSGGGGKGAKGLTFRDIFWRIKLSGEQNILLDVKTENLYEALKQAQQVGCMTERFSYLVTSLDLHTLDLEDFKYSRTRITGFSIINVIKQQQVPPEAAASAGAAAPAQATGSETTGSEEPLLDDKYLERLGVHVPRAEDAGARLESLRSAGRHAYDTYGTNANGRPTSAGAAAASGAGSRSAGNGRAGGNSAGRPASHSAGKYRLSPSVTLERSGSFMDPPQDAYNRDWFRREMLQSSPLSMGLLPSVDRDNELRLFEFFVEQQELRQSRVRMSTASAIMHDSLILLMRAMRELDPTGQLLSSSSASDSAAAAAAAAAAGSPKQTDDVDVCSLDSKPWLHGSSLVNYARQVSFVGLTGRVAFDRRGLRSQFKLDMLGMAPDIGLIKVGEWHSQWRPAPAAAGPASESNSDSNSDSTEPAAAAAGAANESGPAATAGGQERPQGSRAYDELAELYDRQLRRYERLLAEGAKVEVPYGKPIWRQSAGMAPAAAASSAHAAAASPSSSQASSSSSSSTGSQAGGGGGGPALLVNEIIFERLYREQADQVDTLIVTTKLSQPYFMLKETPNKLEGNDQYEGFAVDLVHELSKLINFKYRWREVADRKYGSKEVLPNGTVVWNGMIGELLRGQADLAIVDLTITAQREEAVDFTLPFMNTGISILFKKPTTKVTTLFSFLSPFSSDVWAYVLAAYCGISANLFLVGHLSPYEWADPHPCRHSSPANAGSTEDDDGDSSGGGGGGGSTAVLKNQFSLLNSFWFTIGSLMQQGSDLTPRSMSTRTIAGIWYFFTLIMISSYTANLAAFLTVEKVVYPIENVRDLSQQQEIKYGCVESGSTCTFFHDSQIDTYKRINETMRRYRTYVRSNDEGQKRVEEGKFAFFMESASIEYIVERNCNLTQIGGLLDSKGYGLATSKRSRLKRPYRTLLSEGILHLQETGMLHVLKNRWWKERRGGGTCTDDGKGGGVTELSLANVGGVFVVLLGGLGISFLVAIAEFMWRARRGGSSRDRICEEMMNDLKFALACKRSTKPISAEKRLSRRSKRALLRQQSSSSAAAAASTTIDHHHQQQQHHHQRQRHLIAAAAATEPFVAGPRAASAATALGQAHSRGQQAPAAAAAATAKECDPILLHAMLTMLSQQQQQQQIQQQQQQLQFQQQQQQQPAQHIHHLPAHPIGLFGAQVDSGRLPVPSLLHPLEAQAFEAADPAARRSGLAGARAAELQRQQQQQQLQDSRLSKRRLLFAQRTVDLADDGLPAAPANREPRPPHQHWN